MSVAPCGSRTTASRVHSVSAEERTVAPSLSRRGDDVVAVGHSEGHLPPRLSGVGVLRDSGDHIGEPGRRELLAFVNVRSTVAARWSP